MQTIVGKLAAATVLWAGAAAADPLAGEKVLKMVEADGTAHVVGSVMFGQGAGGKGYSVSWDEGRFGDHFLSMRPFKCLEGAEKHWCHVPYPYAIRREVSEDDLTDLEYDLLFLWKGATEYGINMWNGVYYILEVEGDRLVGQLHEVDMEPLGVPPEEGDLRPIRPGDLHEADPEGHWLPMVVIE